MKTLLMLGAGLKQLPAIRAAKRLGLRVLAIDPNPDSIGFELADERFVYDLADLRRCYQVARRHRVDGVLTVAADYPVPAVAHLCQRLGLPGICRDVARLATNKSDMRRALQAGGVPCPESFHVTELAEAWSAIRKLAQHTIVKPALSNGSQGVTRLPEDPTRGQVQAAFERAMQFTRADGVMVEQFIEGPEFSVEALTANGTTHVVAVTDKLTSEPYCVEIGHSQPSQWPEKDLAEIRTTAAAAVRALGIDWSASHTEIRRGPDGPRVIEVGARLGGGFITSHLVPLSTGVDMLGAAIGLALGERPCLRSTHCRGAAIRFLTPAPGIVQRIDGVDRCRNSIGVCEVVVEVKPGDRIKPLIDNSGRVGHVICDANTARDARHFAQRAADCISIETTATLAGVSPEAVNSV